MLLLILVSSVPGAPAIVSNVAAAIPAELSPVPASSGAPAVTGNTVTVTCRHAYVVVGFPISCKATVYGLLPTGVVTWSSSGTSSFSRSHCRLLRGACSVRYIPTSTNPPADITASYSGDSNNVPSYGTFNLTVEMRTSRTVLTCHPTSAAAGSSKLISCKATVIGYSPAGTVTWSQSGVGWVMFTSSTCILSNRRCASTMVGTTAGKVNITATYGGDPNNTGSSRTRRIVIQPGTMSISYPTMSDETLNKGFIVWEFDMYFPSINLGVVDDLIEGSTSCPCHLTNLTQVGNTVLVVSAGQENITITPSTGYRKIMIASTETMSTAWDGSPTIRPNDVYQQWQQNYSFSRYSGLDVPAGFLSSDNVGFNSWGKAALTRDGVTYWGVGNYWRVTASSGYDPYPVVGSTSIWGVVSTPAFLLSTEKDVYTGGQYGSAFTQDLSRIAYTDGSVYPIQITESNVSCTGETISFTDPRSSQPVSVQLAFINDNAKQWDCLSSVYPGGEIPVSTGAGYYGWIRIHSSG